MIRPLTLEDLPELTQLVFTFYRELEAMGGPSMRFERMEEIARLYLIGSVECFACATFVEQQGRGNPAMVSTLLGRVEHRPFRREDQVLFLDIAYTVIGFRNMGFMGDLLQHAKRWCQERGLRAIELRTAVVNEPAKTFWAKESFRPESVQYRYDASV